MPSSGPAAPATAAPRVVVAILNYNGRGHLEYSLPTVTGQAYPAFDVVVVDNASTDGSADWVRAHHPRVSVLTLERNVGYSALNAALELARSTAAELLVFMTNDVMLDARCLAHAVTVAARHPDVGIIGFDMLGAQSWVDPSALSEASARVSAPEVRDAEWVEGAAMVFRRELVDALGGIDAAYFAYCDEDDLQWRVRFAGYRCVKITTPVWHNAGKNALADVPRRSAYLQMRNYVRYRTKNWGVWEGLKAAAWVAKRACSPGPPGDRRVPYEARYRPYAPWRNAPIVLEACAWNLVHVLDTLSARRTMLARVERARRTKEGK